MTENPFSDIAPRYYRFIENKEPLDSILWSFILKPANEAFWEEKRQIRAIIFEYFPEWRR